MTRKKKLTNTITSAKITQANAVDISRVDASKYIKKKIVEARAFFRSSVGVEKVQKPAVSIRALWLGTSAKCTRRQGDNAIAAAHAHYTFTALLCRNVALRIRAD